MSDFHKLQVKDVIKESNRRFIAAHETAEKDFSIVTRPAQNNDTQRWVIKLK